jgi:hypothetical protein
MLSKLQILRGWESHYGELDEVMAKRFLNRSELNELINFPGELVFLLFHRNKKLELLLKDVENNLESWKMDQEVLRSAVAPRKTEGTYVTPLADSTSYRPGEMVYWRDTHFSDDGPFEKTDSTDWDDYINFEN